MDDVVDLVTRLAWPVLAIGDMSSSKSCLPPQRLD